MSSLLSTVDLVTFEELERVYNYAGPEAFLELCLNMGLPNTSSKLPRNQMISEVKQKLDVPKRSRGLRTSPRKTARQLLPKAIPGKKHSILLLFFLKRITVTVRFKGWNFRDVKNKNQLQDIL